MLPYQRLVSLLSDLGGAVVAFSGGVDSSLLLAAAHDALGARALGVTACSPTYASHELAQAAAVARFLGARHLVIDSHEMDDEAFRANPPDRCYHCKKELFRELAAIAMREGATAVVDGTNHDDRHDVRPGRRAAAELRVLSPLAELGFGKEAIRAMARERGLPNWDAPACACLASRIPYGREITAERLDRVARAEAAIAALGFRTVRVRDHGDVARIEVSVGEIDRALGAPTRRLLSAACRGNGFAFASLDLDGYRTGSMNEVLPS